MSLSDVLAALAIGFAFGVLLQKARLSRYDVIVNVFRLRDLTVIEFMMSALLTAAIGIRLLVALDLAPDVPIPMTYLAGNVLGGVIFGVGMALAGFCPGTVAAGAGEGRLDYLVPGIAGLYAGAIVYGLAYDAIMPSIARVARLGAVTLPDVLHVDPWLATILFAELVLAFYFVQRRGARVQGA